MKTAPNPSLRAAFTLIELLAVILIIGILASTLVPMVTDAVNQSRVTACQANLKNIYNGLVIYKNTFKEVPPHSGVRFFADLIAREAIENTKTNAERLTCPAVEKSALAIGQLPWEEWWTDLEVVDGTYSAYAGRDIRNHPLRKFPGSGSEPLVADDNDGGMNHRIVTNVLYADGSVQTFVVPDLRAEGLLVEEEDLLIVGPDSPVEDLRKLSLD